MGYFGKLVSGSKSLVTGMGITLKELFGTTVRSKAVTLQYPKEKPVLSPAYRSAIKLIRFEETNSHDCVACKACERICPSYCIKLDGGKVEGIKKKRVATFEMDFALCSLCGLCLDVCPTDTLEYSKVYAEAGYNRDWRVDLVEEFRDYEDVFVRKQRELTRLNAELADTNRGVMALYAPAPGADGASTPDGARATGCSWTGCGPASPGGAPMPTTRPRTYRGHWERSRPSTRPRHRMAARRPVSRHAKVRADTRRNASSEPGRSNRQPS